MRNKAAEKAKHAHQQQQAQQQQGQQQGQPGSGGSVSVIAHAPATAAGHPAATAPNAYSISGILGIPAHHQDPNGNSIKRKRTDDGESLNSSVSTILKLILLRALNRVYEFEKFVVDRDFYSAILFKTREILKGVLLSFFF